MANFMKAFEDQRETYLEHYGRKGQKWGVITSEYVPVGDQPGEQEDPDFGLGFRWNTPAMREKERRQQEEEQRQSEYSQQDQESMQQSADAIRQADAESVKDKRKRIVKNIVKGVAIGAIVAGIAAGAVKGFAKKQTGEKQDLATSIGIVGQKFRSAPGQVGDSVKKGFNMDTGAVKAENEAERIRKRNEQIQAFKNAAGKAGQAVGTAAKKAGSAIGKAGQAVGTAAGKAGSAIGTAAGNVKRGFEARSQAAKELRDSINESKNMNMQFGPWVKDQSHIKPGTPKLDFRSIMEEREKSRPIKNMQFGPWAGESGAKKMDFGSIVSERAKNANETNNMDIQNIHLPQGQGRFRSGIGKAGSAIGKSVREDIEALQRWQTIDPKTGMLRNRYNSRRGYYETPRSRIYRG